MSNEFQKSTRSTFVDHIHASRAQLNQLEALVNQHMPDELPTAAEPTNPPHPFVVRNLAKQLNNNLDEAGAMLLRVAEQYAQLWQENEELSKEVLRLLAENKKLEDDLQIAVDASGRNFPHMSREEIWE